MDNDNEIKRYIVNQKELPKFYPTHQTCPVKIGNIAAGLDVSGGQA